MKAQLLTLALAGLFGALVTTDASACCHKKKACPSPATCTAVVPEPCPPPAPVCAPAPTCAPAKKHCGLFGGGGGKKMFGGLCHKKAACAPAPVAYEAPCNTCGGAPSYAPAAYPTAQGYPAPQSYPTGQGY